MSRSERTQLLVPLLLTASRHSSLIQATEARERQQQQSLSLLALSSAARTRAFFLLPLRPFFLSHFGLNFLTTLYSEVALYHIAIARSNRTSVYASALCSQAVSPFYFSQPCTHSCCLIFLPPLGSSSFSEITNFNHKAFGGRQSIVTAAKYFLLHAVDVLYFFLHPLGSSCSHAGLAWSLFFFSRAFGNYKNVLLLDKISKSCYFQLFSIFIEIVYHLFN